MQLRSSRLKIWWWLIGKSAEFILCSVADDVLDYGRHWRFLATLLMYILRGIEGHTFMYGFKQVRQAEASSYLKSTNDQLTVIKNNLFWLWS